MLTNENIGEMIDLLESNYGEKAFPQEPEKLAKTVRLWKVMFQDDDPREVLIAVKDCIATLTFPPKIADIKSRIAQNKLTGQLTETEVWQLIRKAVDDSTSFAEAKVQFEHLPKIVQGVAGSPQQLRAWRKVEDDQFETVIMSMCSRTYRTLAQREAGYHALPNDIQKMEQWRIDGAPKPDALPAPKPLKRVLEDWEKRRLGLSDDDQSMVEVGGGQ